MYRRLVGLLVLAIAIIGFAVFWWTLTTSDVTVTQEPASGFLFTVWPVLYSWSAPPLFAIIAAATIALTVAFIFVGLEIRDINISRRSHNLEAKPLAPWVLMDQTRGVFQGPLTITVLVPAHNEEDVIGATLDELLAQNHKPDRVIVVADNCTDRTIEIARSRGVEVQESVNNTLKKAGALNQVLAKLIAAAGANDTFMVMDADTRLKQGFLAAAAKRFTDDRGLSAIGGLFYGEQGSGYIGQLQRNEYTRYQRDIRRRRGRVFVLTGTASIFRAPALQALAAYRGTAIPGEPGAVYDTAALTEDNEITIALKTLGALMTSPSECEVETELMPTWRMLWRQRLRWQRGALENIAAYGVNSTTTRYWSQQLGIAYSVFALWTFFLLIFLQVFSSDVWIWYPFWLLVGAVFILERVISVWGGGWKARLLAAVLIPELLYDTYLDIIFLKGALDIAFKRQAAWGNEERTSRKGHLEIVEALPGAPMTHATGDASHEHEHAEAHPSAHKNTSSHHHANSHAHGKHKGKSHSKGGHK
jgi:cellulose synthase/poly-beta-1,6-N-acetylglucosamine synthase-like glycosyltransferase